MADRCVGRARRSPRPNLLGRPARPVVYECSGAQNILGGIVDDCPLGTRICTAGGPATDTIPTEAAHIKGVSIQFGGGPSPEDWFEICDLVAAGTVDPSPLVGDVVGFDGLIDAFDRARTPDAPPRIVFRPDR
ncbi:hypothetical protein [Gordonia sp. C13]|uniref:hypothetical protein n=1 Tax=Gordonia sp. C13 TaxID=2935078 RepID=UPI00200B4545|nr:hypothetical protein [Gordonia sp. C13]